MDSFIAWIGGKKFLRKEIISRFPKEFNKYVEVFGGAGWVLFHKEQHAESEIYNDINSDLVNLFKCIKYHPEAIEEELALVLNARQTFEEYRMQRKSAGGQTDIQRAAQYLYLIRGSYGAKVSTFGGKSRDISIIKNMVDIKNRLSKVVIENKSFEALIASHDKADTLFYLDPPYYKTEKMYDTGDFVFDESQHILLRDILANIKGKFILSYNNHKFIKALYEDFHIDEVSRSNNLSLKSGKNKTYGELIIRNF